MKMKIIFVKSEEAVTSLEWSPESAGKQGEQKVMNLNNIREENPQLLIYPAELTQEDCLLFFNQESKFYPVISDDKISLSMEEFKRLPYREAKKIFSDLYAKWVLSNNLQTLEEIFPLTTHLRELHIKDFTTFYEELWFVLKRNLAATSLMMVFHDVHDMEKKKLGYTYIDGERLPQTQSGGEREKQLMALCSAHDSQRDFQRPLQIQELNEKTGQMVATAQIGQSPLLIMGHVVQLNRLQLTLVTSLLEGLR